MGGPRGPDGNSFSMRGEPVRDRLRAFDPARANLDAVPRDYLNEYLVQHSPFRPWLVDALDEAPEVQAIFAALDRGNGHLLQRHGPWVTPRMTLERVRELRDPAIADPARRLPGADAYRGGQHRCGSVATRFTDACALAACFVCAVEHPLVRRVLGRELDPERTPSPCVLPLRRVLGPDGHRYVDGHRLDPADGDVRAAKRRRSAWARTAARDRTAAGPPEPAAPITDFAGGCLLVAFRPDFNRGRHEIDSMFVTVGPDHD